MKRIECIIPNQKFHQLEKSLRHWGVSGMTVTEVKGYGNEQTRPEPYLFIPKTKIEMFCKDDEIDEIVGLIRKTCASGQLGDGKIVVSEIEDLVRIRTGERGEVAV